MQTSPHGESEDVEDVEPVLEDRWVGSSVGVRDDKSVGDTSKTPVARSSWRMTQRLMKKGFLASPGCGFVWVGAKTAPKVWRLSVFLKCSEDDSSTLSIFKGMSCQKQVGDFLRWLWKLQRVNVSN